MTIINTNPDRIIQLGYEGEDKVTILRFSYSEKWLENGEGIFTVRVLRNGENQAYNAQVIKDDRENFTIDMTVTDVELSKEGYGEMQLVYTGADFVKKSPVYKYYVSRSVDEAVDPPESDVYTQIIESLSDLRTNFNELTNTVSEINDDIGDLTELTTANKLNIVESINEVNAKGFASVDDELSDVSTNPVQNKVLTARVNGLDSDVGTLRTSVQRKADVQTVSALADTVQDLDGDVQGLQTTVQGKADTSTVTALSGTVSSLQTSKADKSYVDTQLAGKASTQTVSDLADDVSDLQTGLAGKVGDVQINGSSVVSDGVANVPIASGSDLGVVRINTAGDNYFGVGVNGLGQLFVAPANSARIKAGVDDYKPITVYKQHETTFYGLAKVAGHDEKLSTLPVGTYSDEAKVAIQKMLGIYEAPWELIREDTFTNAEEADHIITTDSNGDAFELTDLVLAFWLPKQSTLAKKGSYGQVRFMKNGADMVRTESGAWDQQANSNPRGFMISMEDHNGMVFVRQHVNSLGGYTASMTMRIPQNFDMTSAQPSIKFAGSDFYIDSINILAVTGTGHYRLYGKRKWT